MVTSDDLNVEKKSGAANFVERAQVQGPECRGCKYALLQDDEPADSTIAPNIRFLHAGLRLMATPANAGAYLSPRTASRTETASAGSIDPAHDSSPRPPVPCRKRMFF
jgi:hypothetical protein